jgi:hypothetical protein
MNIYVVPPNSRYLTFIFAAQMKALGIPPAPDGEPCPLPDKFVPPALKPNPIGLGSPQTVVAALEVVVSLERAGGEPNPGWSLQS